MKTVGPEYIFRMYLVLCTLYIPWNSYSYLRFPYDITIFQTKQKKIGMKKGERKRDREIDRESETLSTTLLIAYQQFF